MKELEMNDRLQAFIQYKTGGRQTDFASLVGCRLNTSASSSVAGTSASNLCCGC